MVLNLWLKYLLVLPKISDFVDYKFVLIQQVLPVVVAILSYILCVLKMFVYILRVMWIVLLNFVVVDYFLFVQNLFVQSVHLHLLDFLNLFVYHL